MKRKTFIIGLNCLVAIAVIIGSFAPIINQANIQKVIANVIDPNVKSGTGVTPGTGGTGVTPGTGGTGVTPGTGGTGVTPGCGGTGVTAGGGGTGVTCGVTNPLGNEGICGLMNTLVNVATEIGAILGVFFIIWAGFLFVTARGSETKLKHAKSVLWTTLIGICILLGASVITKIIIGTIVSIIGPVAGSCGS